MGKRSKNSKFTNGDRVVLAREGFPRFKHPELNIGYLNPEQGDEGEVVGYLSGEPPVSIVLFDGHELPIPVGESWLESA